MKFSLLPLGARFRDPATGDNFVKIETRRARCISLGSIITDCLMKFTPDEEVTEDGLQQEEPQRHDS